MQLLHELKMELSKKLDKKRVIAKKKQDKHKMNKKIQGGSYAHPLFLLQPNNELQIKTALETIFKPPVRIFKSEAQRKAHEAQKGKSSPNKGKKASEKTRMLMRLNSGMKGKKASEETRAKMRASSKHGNHMKGTKRSEATRKIMREKRVFTVIPFKDTKIEKLLQDELSSRGYGYYKHYPIVGQPDLAFPDQKIAIFADGDYWHNREKQKQRDQQVNEKLQEQGWLVLRYWEHEIKANPIAVVDEI